MFRSQSLALAVTFADLDDLSLDLDIELPAIIRFDDRNVELVDVEYLDLDDEVEIDF